MRRWIFLLLLVISSAARADDWKFSFGGATADGFTPVPADALYSDSSGYGFEPPGPSDDKPFYFSVKLPEGNYNVKLVLGDANAASDTTVKAELRRLMLESVKTDAGQFVTRTITVNIRTPAIPGGGRVILKKPREAILEAWAWDDRLTLEFNGPHPALRTMEITPADVPTVFILGDSTVCDQAAEPWNSWGQMLTRFFKPGVAVANHAESGETLRSSLHAHRLEKVLSLMKPGDYLFIQYGHNDMKEHGPGIGPFTSYKTDLAKFVDGARAKGGIPVLVTSMNRKSMDASGHIVNTLGDYPEAVRQLAHEKNVPLIDLNAMSKTLYEAIGPKNLSRAFVDGTHHDAYGSYELAKCVVLGIQQNKLDLAKFIVDDWKPFDPAHPDSMDDFDVPPSPKSSTTKPLGN
ncbi:MAG TPA: rhamnogalacturonan acetylesterase [Tepidisphaeraceae bacterium]|nr:rhamnogalacturonan acetylesterase [Tepidisphaeraceae bacterium]